MSAPFSDYKAFLRGILTNPADLTAWLVYADWLDEHDDPIRAEYLRLQVRREELHAGDPERTAVEARLQELRGELSPNWVAFFDRPPVEHCTSQFVFRCSKRWEELRVTRDLGVRHCDDCQQLVYYCHTLPEAQGHARQGHCVAVSLAVARHPGDLVDEPVEFRMPEGLVMGRLSFHSEPPPPPPPARRPWWKFW
jgi:uncharacterized protein (TIGR02996 family)